MHVAENMVGWRKRLGEYPTLSAIFPSRQFEFLNEKAERFCPVFAVLKSCFDQKWQDATPRFCRYFWWYSSAR